MREYDLVNPLMAQTILNTVLEPEHLTTEVPLAELAKRKSFYVILQSLA